MSSFTGAGLTYGFNLDIVKSASPAPGFASSSSSSSSSSTLSNCSNSSISVSTKRARTPRKRPNQSYNEAAALLSTINPTLFPLKNLHRKHSSILSSFSSSSLTSSSSVLPPFPIATEADFLIDEPFPNPNSPPRFKFKNASPVERSCVESTEVSPHGSPGYIVESIILEQEVEEGIDSIMGKLSMDDCDSTTTDSSVDYCNKPCIGSLMGLGIGGEFEVAGIKQALLGAHNEDSRGPTMMVQMNDIIPQLDTLQPCEKKKTNKKKKKKEVDKGKYEPKITTATVATGNGKLEGRSKCGLGLRLNHEEVLSSWAGRMFPFSCESSPPESSADIAARLAEIDLSLDTEDEGIKKSSILRYKKQRARLSSKKVRYQVQKNTDCQPRVKGRFVKRPQQHEVTEKENQ